MKRPPFGSISRFAVWATVQIVFLVLAALAVEAYLRAHETYLVSRAGSRLGNFVIASDDLITNTVRGRRLIPNAHVVIRHHRTSGLDNIAMDVNALGFRGPEVPNEKSPGELRILALGDSITQGAYLPEEQVYVRRLEHHLREIVQGRRVTVVNAGIDDVGTTEEVDLLEERGLAIAPDIVLLEWYLNDSRPPWGFAGEIGSRGWLRRHSLLAEKGYVYFRLNQWIKDKGENRLRWGHSAQRLPWADSHDAFLELVRDAQFDWGAAWDANSWNIIEANFARLKHLAEQHHFEVVIVAFPVSYQVYAHFIDDTPQRGLEPRVARLGFHYLDLLPILRQLEGLKWQHREFGDDTLFFDQCHPRFEGNDLIARQIARFLDHEVLGTR